MHLGFPGGRSLQSSPRGIAVPTLTAVPTAFRPDGGRGWCREQTQRCGSPASSRRPGKELSGETVQCGHTETSTEAGPVPGPLQLSKGCSQQPAMPGPRSARSGRTPGRTPPLCRRLKGTTELVGSHTSQVPAPAFLGEAWPRTIKGCSRLS